MLCKDFSFYVNTRIGKQKGSYIKYDQLKGYLYRGNMVFMYLCLPLLSNIFLARMIKMSATMRDTVHPAKKPENRFIG